MRKSTLHLSRQFAVHVTLQALLSAGIVREAGRVDVIHRHTMSAVRPLPGIRERLLVTRQVLRERLVERVRSETISSAAAPRPATVMRVEQRNVYPRVQLVMVRSQAAAATVAVQKAMEAPNERRSESRDRPAEIRTASPTVLPPLPPHELSRLTDHVIRQLDRRVVSFQERNARF